MDKPQKQTDQDTLTRSAIAGDHDAFSTLLMASAPRTRSYLQRRYRRLSDDTIDDLMQDASLRAFKSVKNFRGDCAFSSWFTGIAINCANLHLRSGHEKVFEDCRSFDQGNDEDDAPAMDLEQFNTGDLSQNPERIAEHRQLIEKLEERFGTSEKDGSNLAIGFSHAVNNVIEGMSYEEIAMDNEVPIGTVRSRIFRFRKEALEYLKL